MGKLIRPPSLDGSFTGSIGASPLHFSQYRVVLQRLSRRISILHISRSVLNSACYSLPSLHPRRHFALSLRDRLRTSITMIHTVQQRPQQPSTGCPHGSVAISASSHLPYSCNPHPPSPPHSPVSTHAQQVVAPPSRDGWGPRRTRTMRKVRRLRTLPAPCTTSPARSQMAFAAQYHTTIVLAACRHRELRQRKAP